jgi:hypothetical protein
MRGRSVAGHAVLDLLVGTQRQTLHLGKVAAALF